MEDEHTNGKKLARNGHNTVIYKGTFVSNQSLLRMHRLGGFSDLPYFQLDYKKVPT